MYYKYAFSNYCFLFVYLGGLNNHKRTHSDERPYVCEVCGNTFKDPTIFNFHIRRHTGDKPLLCTICGQRMIKPSNILNSCNKPCILIISMFNRSFNGSYESTYRRKAIFL